MSARTKRDVIVIGGGAAGMMAALQAAYSGASVLLLEKNEKLGKKIYITGKGRCNVTNVADAEDFFKQVPRNPRFLNAAVRQFNHEDVTSTLAMLGTETKVERGGRVFPVSDHASDVTRALHHGMKDAGVQVELNTGVQRVWKEEDGLFGVELTQGGVLHASCVIVATGGLSYPSTGSTGDGYRFARENGHTVTPLRGSLVGLTIKEKWPTLLMGLSLKNVRVTAKAGKKKIYDELGEMLFTHFGVSGPLIIELSSHMPEDFAGVSVTLDMKPALTDEQIDLRLQREFTQNARKQLSSVLVELMPARMGPVFAQLCGLSPELPVNQITREQRMTIGRMLKALPLSVNGTRPIEEAIVTRGGVEVKEINPSTMMSRMVPGLFFAGEVLDVDAHTGGFNLQIAFSTGALAGKCAAAHALEE
ncbi:MAG: NAD(P)/FAD-dependent oxidoreductase [Clostridia bacterium]|nr:NAD(P)/FAD-dependent oxidoreductase [Clostridia bacterium]